MHKLTPTSHNELVKKLRMFGFEGPYGGGKHLYMVQRANVAIVIAKFFKLTLKS